MLVTQCHTKVDGTAMLDFRRQMVVKWRRRKKHLDNLRRHRRMHQIHPDGISDDLGTLQSKLLGVWLPKLSSCF